MPVCKNRKHASPFNCFVITICLHTYISSFILSSPHFIYSDIKIYLIICIVNLLILSYNGIICFGLTNRSILYNMAMYCYFSLFVIFHSKLLCCLKLYSNQHMEFYLSHIPHLKTTV